MDCGLTVKGPEVSGKNLSSSYRSQPHPLPSEYLPPLLSLTCKLALFLVWDRKP